MKELIAIEYDPTFLLEGKNQKVWLVLGICLIVAIALFFILKHPRVTKNDVPKKLPENDTDNFRQGQPESIEGAI